MSATPGPYQGAERCTRMFSVVLTQMELRSEDQVSCA